MLFRARSDDKTTAKQGSMLGGIYTAYFEKLFFSQENFHADFLIQAR
jgi:hypothetical protein